MDHSLCPCGNQQSYTNCCGLFIDADQPPKTAEQLMRSRYTAFTQANMDYIERTMRGAPSARGDIQQTKTWATETQWQKLEVLNTETLSGTRALVEFKAYCRSNNQEQIIHERSLFELEDKRWFYVGEAPQRATVQIGRNDPCHCGSGKKYKKCCLQLA